MKASPQPNSGAGPVHKEDAKNENWLFQIKSALREKQKQIAVKKEDLEELRNNSIDMDLYPAFVLDFRNDDVWVAIPYNDFLCLTEQGDDDVINNIK